MYFGYNKIMPLVVCSVSFFVSCNKNDMQAKSPGGSGQAPAVNQKPTQKSIPDGVVPQQSNSLPPAMPPTNTPLPPTNEPVLPVPSAVIPTAPVPSAVIPNVPVPSAVVPNVPVPSAVIPNPPIPPNGVMPPPALPPGVTTTNLLFPAPCLVNQANGYHVTDPGYFVKLSDSSGTLIAAAPMTLDAVTRGSTCQGEYIYGCFNFNIALSFLGKNLKNGSYTGKFSMCHAKDTAVSPAAAECQNLGPDDNLMPFIRVFQHIDLEVGYDVKDNAIEITKYDGGPWDKKLWKQLIVYHPIFAFINPDICQKDFSSPLAFDLNGDDQLSLSDAWSTSGGVLFDIAASGTKVKTGWVAKEDGFLVLGNRVQDGRSLFGEYSFDRNDLSRKGKTFTNGFAALAQYDDNKDNVISQRDAVWSKLNLWRDLNQDGIAQESEIKSLDSYHVVEIKLSYVNAHQINSNNKMILKSSFRDQWNKNHPIYDVWFNVRRNDKTNTNSKGL